LGPGIYFWESTPARALNYANTLAHHPHHDTPCIRDPYVIGAIIEPGNCLNLLDPDQLPLLKVAYETYREVREKSGLPVPVNKRGLLADGIKDQYHMIRLLDCAVFKHLHTMMKELNHPPFDTIRGLFREGEPVFPGAEIMDKDHIQICV
jgi:hypothetical protein